MSKKRYDTSRLENELKGASAFFQSPPPVPDAPAPHAAPPSEKPPKKQSVTSPVPFKPQPEATPDTAPISTEPEVVPIEPDPNERPVARPSVRSNVRTPVRSMSRYAFEFYADQIDALKQRSLDDRIRGGSGNMSQMVRQAIDDYLRNNPREDA